MQPLDVFPDVEHMVMALLEDLAETGLRTPDEFTDSFIKVQRVPGDAGDLVTDVATVELQCFGLSHMTGSTLARTAHQKMLAAPATNLDGACIDRVVPESGPYYVDYGDPRIHRYVARYRVEFRRPR